MSPPVTKTFTSDETQVRFKYSNDFSDSPETYTLPIVEQRVQPLAVVGFSLRFPQDATTPEAFWKMLMDGRSVMTEYPGDRLNINAFYHPDTTRVDTVSSRGGHFLTQELGAFDAPFFSISPAEAADMDPMQRGLLESTYRAFENAGLPLDSIVKSNTSVYTGCFTNDYQATIPKDPQALPRYSATGCSPSMLANRLSWFFDLTGNSVNLDSACSSSMTALHLACQDLWSGASSMSVAAGCNLIFSVEAITTLSNMNFLSSDSRCYSFDHRGNGYARGEGFGVVIIKTLASALENGDTIRAVIRSTGSNQDGYTPGITQPSSKAQELLIRETYQKAGLSMKPTKFFESHGTGTAVGDPIEACSIGAAFGEHNSPDDPLYVGAVKSNIGHLEGASGIAGVIKTILVLENGIIPPNTNFELLNPEIDARAWNLKFSTSAHPWPHGGLRRASVNSFGFGGTNCHVVLDDAYNYLRIHQLNGNHNTTKSIAKLAGRLSHSEVTPSDANHNPAINGSLENMHDGKYEIKIPKEQKLLVWSAADRNGISRLTKAYHEYFCNLHLKHADLEAFLDNLVYTLAERRTLLPWRSFVVINSPTDLHDLENKMSNAKCASLGRQLGFVFTGQGAQWPEMARGLSIFPIFNDSLKEAELFYGFLGASWSLRDELMKPKESSRIDEPELSQALCTAIQVALIDLLESFDVRPSLVVGHSSGEIAAAYCTAAISRRSAWKLAYFRGMLATALAKEGNGAMMAVGLSSENIQPFFDKLRVSSGRVGVCIACYNSKNSLTVSGDKFQIDLLKEMLEDEHVFVRKLQVDVAYHSSHMTGIANHYSDLIGELEPGDHPRAKYPTMVSSVTGALVNAHTLQNGKYWVKNLVSPVKFSGALSLACSESLMTLSGEVAIQQSESMLVDDLIEIGPHSALQAPVREILKSAKRSEQVTYESILIRHQPATETLLRVIGHLHSSGYSVDLGAVNNTIGTRYNRGKVLSDLPEYPFDHSKVYWSENRLSREFRFRKHPRLDLLGTPAPQSTSFERRWRHTLKISELPWMEHHKINGAVLYPASGMLVMAIEAMKQSAISLQGLLGFNIKDTFFQTALMIPSDKEGVEVQFTLLSSPRNSDKSVAWSEFRLYSLANHDAVLICHGSIRPEYDDSDSEVDRGRELYHHQRACNILYESQKQSCINIVDREDMYCQLELAGMQYGSSFRRLEDLSCNNTGDAIGTLTLFQWVAEKGTNHPQPHVIHPTSLDAIFQMMFVATSEGGAKEMPTLVPTRINKLWISSTQLSYPTRDSITVCAKTSPQEIRNGAFVVALDTQNNNPLIVADGIELTMVANKKPQSPSQNVRLCYKMDWKPDLDLLRHEQQIEYCESDLIPNPEPVEFFRDLQFAIMSYITKAAALVDKQQLSEPQYRKYLDWMETQVEKFRAGTLTSSSANWVDLLEDGEYQDTLIARLRETNAQGQTYMEVGRNLVDILQGTVDPLAILFQTGLVAKYYEEVSNMARFVQPMTTYLQTLVHKHPSMKILEIGAGTGGMTRHMLNSMMPPKGGGEFGTPLYYSYDFTDISRSFFTQARVDFGHHGSRLKFGLLDINEDPEAQGWQYGVYDMVIAASVLHVTKDLNKTILRVRKLLKPGGKLILLEPTNVDKLGCGFIFGLLPGWWPDGNDGRKLSPLASQGEWNTICKNNGFSEAEIVFSDYKDKFCQESTIMVFTATEERLDLVSRDLSPIIVAQEGSPTQQLLRAALNLRFQRSGYTGCVTMSLQQASICEDLSNRFCISLLELDEPALRAASEVEYQALQRLFRSGAKCLWISRLGQYDEPPSQGLMAGLSRVLLAEDPMLVLVTLQLESTGLDVCANHIESVLQATQLNIQNHPFEPEYKEIDSLLCCKRVVEDRFLDHHVSNQLSPKQNKTFQIMEGPPLAVSVMTRGLLDSIRFVEVDESTSPLAEDQIEIQVHAIGLNFMDLLTALGRLGEASVMGTECAGVVSRVGSKSNAHFKIGDRVVAAYADLFRTYVRCPYQCAVTIPDSLSFTDAAAIPTTFGTAYHSLHNVAHLGAEDSILIHSAAGATGQSAIQIARQIGAEIFVTVGSDSKKQFLIDSYGISEDHILFSRNTSFAEGIRRMTKGRGVDVVLNSLSGEGLISSWECIAPYGRFVEIGKKDIHGGEKLPMLPFARNVTFSAVDMASVMRDRPAYMHELLETLVQMSQQGTISPAKPLQIYGINEIEQAFRHMQSGQSMGKLVIEVDRHTTIQGEISTKPSFLFDPNSTYVIAGGLGGVGRSLSRWFVSRGAKYLILLSRTGSQNRHSALIKEELKDARIETPPCNIAEMSSLQHCLENCLRDMPPIKGCIQAAVYMKDSTFIHMPYADWQAGLEAKVQGSWNLHKFLPSDMDFFVFLSSVSGIIGRETQANYAAGNTYMDSLAQYRVSIGRKAISLDLGILEEDGLLAENQELMARVKSSGALVPISTAHLYALLDYYCDPSLEISAAVRAQSVIGIETPANLYAKNLEPSPFMHLPTFRHFFQISDHKDDNDSVENSGKGSVDFAVLFSTAGSSTEAGRMVTEPLIERLSISTSIPIEDISAKKPMHQYGVDSLVAIEIRNWFSSKLGADVAVFDLMGKSTIQELAVLAARRSIYSNGSWTDE